MILLDLEICIKLWIWYACTRSIDLLRHVSAVYVVCIFYFNNLRSMTLIFLDRCSDSDYRLLYRIHMTYIIVCLCIAD